MVVVWSSNVQILYKKFALARDFYENIQSAWKSAHWKGIVKETMDTLSNTGGSVKFDRRRSVKRNKPFKRTLRPVCVPFQVSHNSVMITPKLQHPKLPLARMTHIPRSMMKIIIYLVDRPSKSTMMKIIINLVL